MWLRLTTFGWMRSSASRLAGWRWRVQVGGLDVVEQRRVRLRQQQRSSVLASIGYLQYHPPSTINVMPVSGASWARQRSRCHAVAAHRVCRSRFQLVAARGRDAELLAAGRAVEPFLPGNSTIPSSRHLDLRLRGSEPCGHRFENGRSKRSSNSATGSTGPNCAARLDPERTLRRYTMQALIEICRETAIGETGFEPATARPPAGCATRLRHSP